MQKDIIELIEKSTETAMASARKIGELNQRTFEKLFQQQADLAAFYVDASVRSLELMTRAKGYQDLIAGQTAILRELGERNIAALRESVAFANESGNEYGAMFQEGVENAKDQASKATRLVKDAA